MKRWQRALLLSAIWIVLILGTGIYVTDVMLAGKITPQQEEQLSGVCGAVCAGGVVLICAVVFSRKRSRPS